MTFPRVPTGWGQEEYKAILAQLPKLGMNWIGFHCYPESGVGPEPLVWIGLPEDIGEGTEVRFSYPALTFSHFERDRGLGLSADADQRLFVRCRSALRGR